MGPSNWSFQNVFQNISRSGFEMLHHSLLTRDVITNIPLKEAVEHGLICLRCFTT